MRRRYARVVGWLDRRLIVLGLTMLAVSGGAYLLFQSLPAGFLPEEDQGNFFAREASLPDVTSLTPTESIVGRIGKVMRKNKGVEHVVELSGFDMIGGISEPNAGTVIAILKPWGERGSNTAQAIIDALKGPFNSIPAATVTAFNPPAIPGRCWSRSTARRPRCSECHRPTSTTPWRLISARTT